MRHFRSLQKKAFTLLELIVAIAIVGIISVVILSLFDTTSQNFLEVDQLANLNDRVRFSTELVRNQIQAAGSQSTPDSTVDSWVAPPLPGTARVAGLYPYAGWQDDRSMLPADIQTANPKISFDGVVIAGAYDFPLAFEFAGMNQAGGVRKGRIFVNYRGLGKLMRQDPFVKGSVGITPVQATLASGNLTHNWSTRLIRLSDRQGYQQFVQPLTPISVETDAGGRDYLEVALPVDGSTFAPKFKGPSGFYGIDDLPEGDTGYDAGLIDFFWIHVVADDASPNVMTLVRDRLCGATVVSAGAGMVPSSSLATTCPGGVAERVVLASYVADFQVWFDCADPADGAVRGTPWSQKWIPNDNSGAADCMKDNATSTKLGLARVGHIRLSMHTSSERKSQAHIQFEDALGAICPPAGTCDDIRLETATLRTYDFYPKTQGAARVVVMQSDFELVNYVNRNPL